MRGEQVGEAVGTDNLGADGANGTQGPVEHSVVHLHAPCVDHRAKQGVVGQFLAVEQRRHAEQLERADRDERYATAVADTLGRRHPDAQPGVRTRSGTDSHSVERDGVAVGKRQCFGHVRRQECRVGRAVKVFFVIDARPVLAERHGADGR